MRIVNQLDKSSWTDFVDNHSQANVFHTPEMFEVFSRTRGFHPRLWAVIDDDGQILALLLPVYVTVLGGVLTPLTTRAVVYGSVLSSPGDKGHEALNLLLGAYRRQMKGRLLFTELRNLADLGDSRTILDRHTFAYEEHLNFLIDLNRPSSEIWQSIRSNARRNIEKARRSGVVIEEVTAAEQANAAYSILKDVYKRIRVPLPDRSLFYAALGILRPEGMLRLLLAKVEGRPIGALTLLLCKGVIYYWYTGTLRAYASYRAGDFLVWHALEWGSQNGFHTFDFGGGGRPDEEYGVRDFKAKFGGKVVNFGRNRCVHAPIRLRLSEGGYQLLRRFL